jgi:hypothetical protein
MCGARTEEQPKVIASPTSPFDSCGSFFPSLSDLAFLIPIVVLFWCTTGVGWLLTDSDTGWHIRAGEWMLNNGRVPTTDVFSFTMAGKPWFAWEWLSDVFMAIIHRSSGLPGLVLASLLLLGATAVCVYKSIVAESEQRLIAIVLTSLAMAASTIHWLARPHLVTPLMAAIFCWVLNHVERASKPRVLLALPLLTILWVNLHGGFFVGIVLLISYGIGAAAGDLVQGIRRNAWIRGRPYFLTAGACVVASLLNPYGYRLHVHVARYLGASFYLQHVSEFQSIDFHSFTAAYFETMLVLAIAAAVWHLGSGRLIHVTLLLSWSHLALFSARNIPIFAVVTAPSIGLAAREWLKYATSHWTEQWPGKLATNLEELDTELRAITRTGQRMRWHLVPCCVVLVLALSLAHPGHVKALRAEFDHGRFPVDAAGVLSQRVLSRPTHLYSSWQWGGYLIYRVWPSINIFNDGRTDFYGPVFVEEGLRAWEASPEWNNILTRYGVNAALLPVDSALASVLRERRDWEPVYQDQVAVLFEKREDVK